MKHNLLEKLGVSIPQLGLGCMRLPTDNAVSYTHLTLPTTAYV